jgi:pyridoxine 5-phosphate synthase
MQAGISVSLFLDPDPRQIELAKELGADAVELHTGQYALARGAAQHQQLVALTTAGKLVCDLGMHLHAGHGLNYHNVVPVARIPAMRELNIGHSIVSRAVLVGLERAVRDMKHLIG